MRIPSDISLTQYIRQLQQNNKMWVFYKSKEWLELKQEVMQENHYECYECMKKARYTRADCVHHINEVLIRPDLALSKFYTDKDGNKKKNLVPLCNRCHNLVHDKLGNWQKEKRYVNDERW